ncbi:MAG: hypothetical protein QNJ97_01210 [Myxococcota bacterium]|nr:hypothetical protein [Myxococcota bacterium]
MIQTIVIGKDQQSASPAVRLAGHALGSLWEFASLSLSPKPNGTIPNNQDLNIACHMAARLVAEKVSRRGIRVELIIDPVIPPIGINVDDVVPIITSIAENASASVEPGPGTVILRTWWHKKYAGVDAIGRGGSLPEEIRTNLMSPCFTTRVADWDTGFGLFSARKAAAAIRATVELFEPNNGVGFRLAVPIGGTSLSPPEAEIGLSDKKPLPTKDSGGPTPLETALWESTEVMQNVGDDGVIEA